MLNSQNLGLQDQFPANFGWGGAFTPRLTEVGWLGQPESQAPSLKRRRDEPSHKKMNRSISLPSQTVQKLQGRDSEQVGSEKPLPALLVKPRVIGTYTPKDRSKEYQWLHQHRDLYANQWVALSGDELVSHGPEFKEVIAVARKVGVPDALMIFVEPSDTLPFVRV